MPTATVWLARDCKYLVVSIRPKREAGEPTLPELPAGLFAFAGPGYRADPGGVGLKLEKDEMGKADAAPLLAACDYLRDQGWAIDPSGMDWIGPALAAG